MCTCSISPSEQQTRIKGFGLFRCFLLVVLKFVGWAHKEWCNFVMVGRGRKISYNYETGSLNYEHSLVKTYTLMYMGTLIHCLSAVSWLKYPRVHRQCPDPCGAPRSKLTQQLSNIFSKWLFCLQGSCPLGYLKITPLAPQYAIWSTSPHSSPLLLQTLFFYGKLSGYNNHLGVGGEMKDHRFAVFLKNI